MKIRPVGAELFHADGRTDMTKLTVAFRNFGNAPKNSAYFPLQKSQVFITDAKCVYCAVRTESIYKL
jgi:hypothetical protein